MNTESMYTALGITPAVHRFGEEVLAGLRARFDEIDRVAEYNQCKVIGAMQKNRVDATHFAATTGYGYNDAGRDNLERVYADCFHTEAALVRPQITCGTHALTVALSANLLPGDTLLSPVGAPYDTLEEVIGIRPSACSLKEYGVHYRQVDLLPDYGFDYPAIEQALRGGVKLVTIQRSKGYATRPTFSVQQIGELIAFCKRIDPNVICMVDNCYGEFVETIEPSDLGADMIVGSLIKNPGGGLAPIGGYICGRQDLVDRCAFRLSAPGLGQEVGANLGLMPAFYQGFFLAPTVTAGALKGAVFAANVYERLGFRCIPNAAEPRHDIIQCVELGSPERMVAFCKGIQAAAPVDSYVDPIPWAMPGYDSEVIMAAGAFVQGSSIELSADGPIRPPYAVYFQGIRPYDRVPSRLRHLGRRLDIPARLPALYPLHGNRLCRPAVYRAFDILADLQQLRRALVAVLCLCTGALSDYNGPQKAVILCAVGLVCLGVVGLGVVEAREDDDLRRRRQEHANRKYAKSWLAICLPVAYCLLDAAGTFADSLVLERLNEDSANVAYELTFLAAGIGCLVYLLARREKFTFKAELPKYVGAACETVGQLFYIYALADEEHVMMSAPIISAYCVASVLWSRLFLKEKLSWKHYLMIGFVVAGIVILGIYDI